MGADESTIYFDDDELTALCGDTNSSSDEIMALYKCYTDIAVDDPDLGATEGELIKLFDDDMDLQEIMQCVFRIADENSNGRLSFKEFVMLVFYLSEKCDDAQKAKFIYKVLANDVEKTGEEITADKLRVAVEKTLRIKGISDDELIDRSVADAMQKLSKTKPGCITLEEFCAEAERNRHILDWLKIDIDRVIRSMDEEE